MSEAINLEEKLATFNQPWSPKTVALFNGHDVMVVKAKGAFNWHSHPDTGDFFLVLKGQIELRDRTVRWQEGEMFVVPKGVEHRPVAAKRLICYRSHQPLPPYRITGISQRTG